MPMYKLLEYRKNYSMTSGNFWNYYRDEVNDSTLENDDNGNQINNSKTMTSKSFEYKTKIIGRMQGNLSNIWRYLDLPLINCEIELDLRWKKNYLIS